MIHSLTNNHILGGTDTQTIFIGSVECRKLKATLFLIVITDVNDS